jgi:ethanolamine utilization protein EutN
VQVARVIGDVVATYKDPGLASLKLLVLQPLGPDKQPAGRTLIAADAVGAGIGEIVFFVRGREASFPFHPAEAPVDAGIVGIVDHWDMDREDRAKGEGPRAKGQR